MSKSTQTSLTGASVAYLDGRDHLKREPPNGYVGGFHAAADRREAFCHECNCRVTVTASGQEAGHKLSCEHHCHDGERSSTLANGGDA